jgi:hypothetical protein
MSANAPQSRPTVGDAFRPPARWPFASTRPVRKPNRLPLETYRDPGPYSLSLVTDDRIKAFTEDGNHGVKDEDEDYDLPIWAGVLPLTLVPGVPIPDPRLLTGLEAPEYAVSYRRPTNST